MMKKIQISILIYIATSLSLYASCLENFSVTCAYAISEYYNDRQHCAEGSWKVRKSCNMEATVSFNQAIDSALGKYDECNK